MRLLFLFLAILPGLLGTACVSGGVPPARRTTTGGASEWSGSTTSAPGWHGQPLSWAKLQRIENWLAGPGPETEPHFVPEAELQLAEGRLQFARRDSGGAPGILDTRLTAAEAGFRRVVADHRATGEQRRRAERGLADLRGLHATPTAGGRAPAIGIQPRSAWRAKPPSPSRMTRNRQRWSRITVHHSALPQSDLGNLSMASVADAIRRIQLVHMRDQSYGDIGYHFIIDPAGRIFAGRDLSWQGAHAGGRNNVGNIGICLLGDFDHERPDPRALRSLDDLVTALSTRHKIAASNVHGHREFKATACPGRNLMAWVDRFSTAP